MTGVKEGERSSNGERRNEDMMKGRSEKERESKYASR